MCGDWLAGPDRADFVSSVVTNGKDKIHLRRTGFCELVPTLAAESGRGKVYSFKLFQGVRIHGAGRKASCAECAEVGTAPMVEDRLRHDGARRIAGAEKEHVVDIAHKRSLGG